MENEFKALIALCCAIMMIFCVWVGTKIDKDCPECNPHLPKTEAIGVDREIVYTNGRTYYINEATNSVVLLDTIQAKDIDPYNP